MVWVWKAGQCSRPASQTGQQWPARPRSLPESGSQDFVLPAQAWLWARKSCLQVAPIPDCILDAPGTLCTCLLPPPLPTYSLGDFLLFIQTPGYLLQTG